MRVARPPRQLVRALLPAVIGGLAAVSVTGQQDEPRPLVEDPHWVQRLEVLRPGQPMAYFELAEEFADRAVTEEDRRLARQLFGLAGVLDPVRLGPSACLALADLESREHLKRRLRALAMLLAERSVARGLGDPESGAEVSRATAVAVADAFGHYRRGLGSRALAALRRPGATEMLGSLDHLLPGGVDRFLEDCRVYRGGQATPQLTEDEQTMMLRVEAALLAGAERRWSGQLLLQGGQPLVEVDPERLPEMLAVDPGRPFFRHGRWAAQPGRPVAEPGG